MTTPRVVVIGGGITGLSLAFTLHEAARRRGAALSLNVLEGGPRAGGHVQTRTQDGFVIEAGPNGFLNREPHTLELIDAAGLRSRLIEARKESARRFILRGGALCRVPEGPASLLASPALSWRGKLRLALEPFAPSAPAGVEETVYDFSRRRIGSEAAEMLVDAAVSGISAGDSRNLSVSAQFPIMTEMEREHGSLVRALFARRGRGQGPAKLMSFDGGLGTLTERLAEQLGAMVQTDRSVRSIDPQGSGWRVELNDGQSLEADHVALALPARAAAPLVQRFDPGLTDALREIPYSGIGVVALGYRVSDVPMPLDGYGYLVTRPEGLATLGVLWESSIFSGRAASGTALLRVFLGGARRPEVVEWSESRLQEIATQELAQVMGIRATPLHVSTYRWPGAIAQYTVGHDARRNAIRARLSRFPGLSVCGTSYDGVSFNHAIRSGRLLAADLVAKLWDERMEVSV